MLQGRAGASAGARTSRRSSRKARQRDGMRAFESLTAVVDGRRVILEDPPVVTHVEVAGGPAALEKVFTDYRATMPENRRDFLERYRFVDFALKVVGVGSVGTRCFVIVLEGRDENDPLILQAKEATASVLEPYLAPSLHDHHGQRVVVGQQLMQATSDIFLGWTRGPGGRDFYFRQLWDMKGSVDTTILQPPGPGLLRRPLRLGPRPGPRPHGRRGRDLGLPRDERHVRRGDRRLRGDVRRRQRARPRGVRGRHRGGAGLGAAGLTRRLSWERRPRARREAPTRSRAGHGGRARPRQQDRRSPRRARPSPGRPGRRPRRRRCTARRLPGRRRTRPG